MKKKIYTNKKLTSVREASVGTNHRSRNLETCRNCRKTMFVIVNLISQLDVRPADTRERERERNESERERKRERKRENEREREREREREGCAREYRTENRARSLMR